MSIRSKGTIRTSVGATQEDALAYSVEELARLSGFSRSWLFARIARGDGPPCKRSGTRIVVLREDALAWLKGLPDG